MAVLTEGSFELDGYRFGGDSDPLVTAPNGFDPGAVTWRVQDQDSSAGDHIRFGRDLRNATAWTWEMFVNRDTAAEALSTLEEASAHWMNAPSRSIPGAVSELRYRIGGRDRMVYGRPRRFTYNVPPALWSGTLPVLADFQLADTMTYGDEVQTQTLGILPGSTTGLTSPLTGVLSTTAPNEKAVSLSDIGGSAPAPFTALIHGPITNPWIKEDGWRLDISTTLAYDRYLIIDTRPWMQTVLRDDGVSLAGSLSRTSRLSNARLKPGGSVLTFGGTDATGTAYCSIKWRPTFYSL